MSTPQSKSASFTDFMARRKAELSTSHGSESSAKQQAWHDFQQSVYLYETDPALVRQAAQHAYQSDRSNLNCTQEQYCHWYCAEADSIQQAASQKSSNTPIIIGLCASILAAVIWLMFFAA